MGTGRKSNTIREKENIKIGQHENFIRAAGF
jgi:hypothetical protein